MLATVVLSSKLDLEAYKQVKWNLLNSTIFEVRWVRPAEDTLVGNPYLTFQAGAFDWTKVVRWLCEAPLLSTEPSNTASQPANYLLLTGREPQARKVVDPLFSQYFRQPHSLEQFDSIKHPHKHSRRAALNSSTQSKNSLSSSGALFSLPLPSSQPGTRQPLHLRKTIAPCDWLFPTNLCVQSCQWSNSPNKGHPDPTPSESTTWVCYHRTHLSGRQMFRG